MSIQKINIVRKNLTEKNLLNLIKRNSETDRHDYKRELNISKSKDKYEFIKDVAAFSNARGGYIIVGISDDYRIVGVSKKIETSNLSELLESYFGYPFDLDHMHFKINDKMLCLIYIPAIVDKIVTCPKDVTIRPGKKQINIIHKDDVFFRRGTRSVKATKENYEFMMRKINYFEQKSSYVAKNGSKSIHNQKAPIGSKDKTLKNAVNKLSKYWLKLTEHKYELNENGKGTLIDFLQFFSVEELKRAIQIAFSKPFLKNVEDRFKYFCGIIQNWKSDKFDSGERSILKRAKTYFQNKPRGSGYFVDDKFKRYASIFDWEIIKAAIDETFSQGRSNYFQALCDILDNKIPSRINMKDGDIVKIPCAFCEGSGIFPKTATSDDLEYFCCDVCNGKGIIVIRSKTEIVKCKFCNGSGKGYEDGYFLGQKCEACNGLGIQPLFGSLKILK